MTSEPRLWLLCGPSFAGKSKLAGDIATTRGATIVSPDAINEERGVGWGGDGLSPSVWAATLDLALERLDQALAAGHEAVVDDTCCFRWLRDRYRAVAADHGASVVLIRLDVSLDEIQRRRRANDRRPERRPIRDEIFDQHVRTFEWPTDDESPVGFAAEDRFATWWPRVEAVRGSSVRR